MLRFLLLLYTLISVIYATHDLPVDGQSSLAVIQPTSSCACDLPEIINSLLYSSGLLAPEDVGAMRSLSRFDAQHAKAGMCAAVDRAGILARARYDGRFAVLLIDMIGRESFHQYRALPEVQARINATVAQPGYTNEMILRPASGYTMRDHLAAVMFLRQANLAEILPRIPDEPRWYPCPNVLYIRPRPNQQQQYLEVVRLLRLESGQLYLYPIAHIPPMPADPSGITVCSIQEIGTYIRIDTNPHPRIRYDLKGVVWASDLARLGLTWSGLFIHFPGQPHVLSDAIYAYHTKLQALYHTRRRLNNHKRPDPSVNTSLAHVESLIADIRHDVGTLMHLLAVIYGRRPLEYTNAFNHAIRWIVAPGRCIHDHRVQNGKRLITDKELLDFLIPAVASIPEEKRCEIAQMWIDVFEGMMCGWDVFFIVGVLASITPSIGYTYIDLLDQIPTYPTFASTGFDHTSRKLRPLLHQQCPGAAAVLRQVLASLRESGFLVQPNP